MADNTKMSVAFEARGADLVSREAKKIEQSLQKLVGQLDNQARAMTMTAREMDLYKAKTLMASQATLKHINSVHDSIDAQKRQAQEVQASIDKAKAEAQQKQAMEAVERKRADSINAIINELKKEKAQLTQSNDEIQIRKAMVNGATDAELKQIHAMQQSIASHKAKLAEEKQAKVATAQAKQATEQKDRAIDKIIQTLNDEKVQLSMTTDEIQLYKAEKMGATKAQLDSIRVAQQQIKAEEKMLKSQGKLKNSLQMMRGGFGQVGHQIQDISIQAQMGTNSLIILGQQGSQIASLFGGGGAMIGAFIAVGAAIYTYLNAESVEAQKKIKKLKDEMKELSLTAEGLDRGLGGMAIVETNNKISQLNEQVKQLSEGFEDSNDKLENRNTYIALQSVLSSATYGFSELVAGIIYSDSAMKEASENVILHTYYTEELKKKQDEQAETLKRLEENHPDPFFNHAKSSEKFTERLTEQSKQLGMTADDILRFDAIKTAGGDPELARENLRVVESFIIRRDAMKALADSEEAQRKRDEDAVQAQRDRNEEFKKQLQQNKEFVQTVLEKSKATEMDKYQTILSSDAYKKLSDTQKEQVNQAIEAWRVADKAIKKAEEESKANKEKRDTITSMMVALAEENEALRLQTELKHTAGEAELILTLRKQGATQATIDSAIALEREIKAKRDSLALDGKTGKTDKKDKDTFGSLSADIETDLGVLSDIDGVMDGFKTEQDLLKEHYEEMNAIIEEGEALSLITKQEMADMKAKIDADYVNATEQANLNAMNSIIGSAQSQMQALQGIFDESTAIGKAFYVASQMMSAGQAIISGLTAKMNVIENSTALGMDGATASALGQTMAVMGYATAGAIMGQTLASFEGGGITFNGVRSGGVDGKGGRMAVVHPNEKITDLEKGGGTGDAVNVSFTINAVDTQGFDQLLQSRRGQIVGMVQKAVNNVGRRIM